MVRRNPARYLAPVALVTAAVGAFVIVSDNVNSNSSPTSTTPHELRGHAHTHPKFARRRFYTVQPGDNLGSISAKTGVSVNQLEQLNPLLDPNSLQMGQRLRLRR